MGRGLSQYALSIAVTGDEPPSEFRIFAAGEVDTVKGKFLFDDVAARKVMAEYRAHGIDLMVDYDHASLAPMAVDPAQSGKAAAWFNLEVRNGELWAVNVRWTPPAAEALKRKEWRFMSPAFSTDEKGRITSLLNVAITNLPATRNLQPLMAANALGGCMDPKMVQEALDALIAGDTEKAAELLKGMIASAASGEAPAGESAPPDAMAETPAAPPAEDPTKDEEKAAVAASISRLTRITGKTSIGDAVDEVELWRKSHIELDAEKTNLAKEREALELNKRKENAATLVKLGAETPHTSGLAKGKLVQRLLDEPLAEQTERVKQLLAAKGGKLPETPKPPVVNAELGKTKFETPHGVYELAEREQKICERLKIDPAKYAANRTAMAARNVTGA